jgi:hypothetical protein
MSRGDRRPAQSVRHFLLLERHHKLRAAHRLLQQKAFNPQEHADHKLALGRHLATLVAHRLDAKRTTGGTT